MAALAAAWQPPPAGAHGESSPFVRTVVDDVQAPAPGVQVVTEAGNAVALRVANRGPAELEVTAPRGEPFLRIGPRGTFANVASLYWYQSGNPDAIAQLPPAIPRGAPPRWVRVSEVPTWTWFEHRLHPAPISVPPGLAGTQRRQTLFEWSVPIRVGGRPGQIDGHVEYRTPPGRVVTALTSAAQPLPEVFAGMVPGPTPGLLIQNLGPRPLTVLGREGEPFARIGPRGVDVNLRSPTHQDDARVKGARPSTPADPKARPHWRRISDAPQYLWLDSRARYGTGQPPDRITERRAPTVLARWTVPLESPEGRTEVRGTTTWVPAPRPAVGPGASLGRSSLWLGLIGIVLALAVGLILLRLRRNRAAPLRA